VALVAVILAFAFLTGVIFFLSWAIRLLVSSVFRYESKNNLQYDPPRQTRTDYADLWKTAEQAMAQYVREQEEQLEKATSDEEIDIIEERINQIITEIQFLQCK